MAKNYYHTLGLSPNATAAEIKAAYKRLALKFHPDKNPGNVRAEEQFKLVNEAYQVLSNPRRRATYDLQRQYEQQQRQAQAYSNPRYHHTRSPAGYRERYYRQRPQQKANFSKRDIQIVLGVVLLALLLALGLKLGWDHLVYSRVVEQAQEAELTGQWEQAQEAYSTVLEYKPELQEMRIKRAALRLQQLNDAQGALSDYSWLIRNTTDPKAEWYAARGKCYLALKNHNLAIQDFNVALTLAPAMVHLYQDRAVANLQAEQNWPAALADLTHYLNSEHISAEEKTEAFLYRAFAHYRTQEWISAWIDTEQALTQDSTNAKAYFLQALIARAQQGEAVSCELLAKAAQLGFRNAEAELEHHCAEL
ncbi:tetratricopeptide repeat protein [Rufibacter roseus]|uniref:DnaJ domain-containing protein n=1 Tax=Rufibacter roseus TaxID=1567108 RepID=A0ABW2DFU7_9BACT|nr:tetratricopeptide repeat protein [Rufibacter roseus]